MWSIIQHESRSPTSWTPLSWGIIDHSTIIGLRSKLHHPCTRVAPTPNINSNIIIINDNRRGTSSTPIIIINNNITIDISFVGTTLRCKHLGSVHTHLYALQARKVLNFTLRPGSVASWALSMKLGLFLAIALISNSPPKRPLGLRPKGLFGVVSLISMLAYMGRPSK